MISYPEKTTFTDFSHSESALERSAVIDPSLDIDLEDGSQSCDSDSAVLKAAVTSLILQCGQKKSTSFTDRDELELAAGADNRFYFAPGVDKTIDILFEFENPELITKAEVQIFSEFCQTPLCKHALSGDQISAGKISWNGTFGAAENALKKPPQTKYQFDVPTVDHSPFLAVITIAGEQVDQSRSKAWSIFDILVHEIKLSWGKADTIPLNRPDIKPYNILALDDDDADYFKKALQERQKRMFAQLIKDVETPQAGSDSDDPIDIVLDVSVFDYDLANSGAEFLYMRDLWGEGPLIPIYIIVQIKNAAGNGCDAPPALGKGKLLWEWRDNDASEDAISKHIESWIGPKDDTTSSEISRLFLDTVFKNSTNEKFPHHTLNCPATAGGKRGKETPFPGKDEKTVIRYNQRELTLTPGHVFPAIEDETFPFTVSHECKQRTWGAISEINVNDEILNANEEVVHSGVLFQPAAVAGDRYKLCVHFVPGTLDTLDSVGEGETCTDLLTEAEAIPHAQTPYFNVLRKINADFISTSNQDGAAATNIEYIKQKCRQELGYVLNIEKRGLPDLEAGTFRTGLNAKALRLTSHGTYMYYHFSQPSWKDDDYVIGVRSIADVKDDVEAAILNNKIIVSKSSRRISGHAVKSNSSDAIGVVLDVPDIYAAERTQTYCILMLSDDDFTENETVTLVNEQQQTAVLTEIAESELPVTVEDETVTIEQRRTLSSRHIHLKMKDSNDEVDLNYTEGFFRPTRSLSDARKQQIMQFLYKAVLLGKTITIYGNELKTRERKRSQNVKDFIVPRLLDRTRLLRLHIKKAFGMFTRCNTMEEKRLKFYHQNMATIYDQFSITHLFEWIQEDSKLNAENFDSDEERIAHELKLSRKLYFFNIGAFSDYNKKFSSGAMDVGRSIERLGYARITTPPGQAEQKRWLKAEKVIAAHEFGHSLLLKHAAPNCMDSLAAPGAYEEHLAHDRCIMNYDADTESFCAACILRKRGWYWQSFVDGSLGRAYGNEWVDTCKTILKAKADEDDNDPAKIRYSLFMLDVNAYASSIPNEPETAVSYMGQIDSDKKAWIYRNMIYLYHRLKLETQNVDTKAQYLSKAEEYAGLLFEETQHIVDISDVTDSAGVLRSGISRCKWRVGKQLLFIKIYPCMDFTRDGTTEPCITEIERWESGTEKRGAIIPRCSSLKKVNDDGLFDTGSGIFAAPLKIRMEADVLVEKKEQWDVNFNVAEQFKEIIRLYDDKNQAILDGSSASAKVKGLDSDGLAEHPDCGYIKEWQFWVYSTRYAGEIEDFDGKITLNITAGQGGRVLFEYAIELQVAPWIMPHNNVTMSEVCVADWSTAQKTLTRLADENYYGAPHLSFKKIPYKNEYSVFMQDILTCGYQTFGPERSAYSALLAPPNEKYNQEFIDYINTKMDSLQLLDSTGGTYDSMGNLECTPPVDGYPFGRLYYGKGENEGFAEPYIRFFKAQGIQKPIEIDTSWLTVGHVDEVISFIPNNGNKGFKMLIASPKKAYDIMEENQENRVLVFFKTITDLTRALADKIQSAQAFYDSFRNIKTDKFLKIEDIKTFNLETCQPELDTARELMKSEIGITDDEIIDVPIVYYGKGGKANAITPCCVNCVVINDKLIVPQPYGSVLRFENWDKADADDVKKGRKKIHDMVYVENKPKCRDLFWEYLKTEITKDGNQSISVLPIETWDYHKKDGQVHCASNLRHAITHSKWWEIEIEEE